MNKLFVILIGVVAVLILIAVTIVLIRRQILLQKFTSNDFTESDIRITMKGTSQYLQSDHYVIPKIIWAYWHSSEFPPFIQFNLKRWKKRLGEHFEIRFLTKQSLHEYIPAKMIPKTFSNYSNPHQADWIRLYLLKEFGGIWADSGILFNKPNYLNRMYEEAMRLKVDYAGFDIKLFQTDSRYPIVENWFIMAPQPHAEKKSFLNLWFHEYDKALQMGFSAYRKYAEQTLNIDPQLIFKGSGNETYLTCHLCCQTLLQKHMPDVFIYLWCAEDTMFRLQSQCDWNAMQIDSIINHSNVMQLPMIKLRAPDRKNFSIQAWEKEDQTQI